MITTKSVLEGKRVVVLGGASGIGFAVATRATELGAEVVIGSTNKAKVDAAAAGLRGASGRAVDLRDEASVKSFFSEVGAFDHLVLTAGDWDGPIFVSTRDVDLTEARKLLEVRFWGALAAVKYGSSSIAEDGSFTLTSGMLAARPMKGAPLATAMAGAVEHLTYGLARDLAPIRVNAVSPGLILTEHVKQMPEAALQSMVAPLPIPRGAEPAEAAEAYVYLMSNAYATGQVLCVDGGGLLV